MPTLKEIKWMVRSAAQKVSPRLTAAILANRSWVLEPEIKLLPHLAKPGRLAMDVGANKGVYLTHMSRHFARVVAFEPNPELAAYLTRAAPANAEVIGAALSRAEGEASLSMPRRMNELGSLESVSPGTAGGVERDTFQVALKTLDSFAFQDVDFIKIDVEGHEHDALEGARETIARCRPAILVEVEERHRSGGVAALRSMLETAGYQGFFLDDGRLRSIAEFDLARDQNCQNIEQSVKVARYINNFLYLPGPGASARAASISAALSPARR